MATGDAMPAADGTTIRIVVVWNARGEYAYGDPHDVQRLINKIDDHASMRTVILAVHLPSIETPIYGVTVPPDTTEVGVALEVKGAAR